MELSKAHFHTMSDAESKQLFIDFVKLVRSMRDKQKEYFQTRNAFVLRDAKKLESMLMQPSTIYSKTKICNYSKIFANSFGN